MQKRDIYHAWKVTRNIKPGYLLAITVVSSVVCVSSLRANNEHMSKLRDAVYAADKNNTDIQTPLRNLQLYVTRHMNTNLSSGPNGVYPPIQLKYTYDRLVSNSGDTTADANSKIYNDAQHYCEQQNSVDFSGRNRVPCIEDYVQSHRPEAGATISDSLYKFAFASPRWSPDLAGWSMVLAIASLFAAVVLFGSQRLLKKLSH